MSLRSLALQRCVAFLATVLIVSACTENGREAPLSQVDLVPPANAGPQSNQNINSPTLNIPATFGASPGETLTLVWSDEFDGAQLDPDVWFFATGDGTEKGLPGGWGNNELQYYLPDSAQLANGILSITARRETIGGLNFTSARLNTEDRFAFLYGRIEASIKMPPGQGLWPAFWMLPQDTTYGGWAASGEIDIMEAINLDGTGGNEIFGTLHFGGEFPANTSAETRYTPSTDVTDDFHTYALEWDATEMRWYYDDTLYAVQNSTWSSTAAPFPAPFDQPFHVLLNLAVGGNFPGSPDGTTVFPATMEVDWVRVYSGEDGVVTPADPGTIPDDVIYASDPNEMVDIVFGVDYTEFSPFDSGSTFDNNITTDPDFNPAFGVTTGNGYGAQVGQFAIVGFTAGFATGYGTLDFKAKGLNNDLIRVKFLDAGEYLDITLSGSPYSTDLGNGWYQVSVPIADFSGVDTSAALLFETDNTAPSAFTFLLTDIGFSGTAGGGGDGTFVNGDFETGDFTGWTLTQVPTDRGSITLDSSGQGGRAGTVARLVAAGDAAGTNDVLISQVALAAGTVASGDSIDVSFDLYGSLTGAGGVVFVEVIFLNGAGEDEGGRNFVGPAAPYVPSTTWTTHSGTVIAGTAVNGSQWDVSGGVTLELKAACGAIVDGCGVDASFDNVTFTIN